ncbi:unnamed protein product [Lathyrus sativus]|nr:unnamed protein product [Lathyrus sativus]
MGDFIEDGSDEAIIDVIHALIAQLTTLPVTTSTNLTRRQERANVFCEAIRVLDATDLFANSVKDHLLPAIQNLLKYLDALDPAHKEALDIIMKERSVTSYSSISNKVVSTHVCLASSMSSFFGDGGLLGKRDNTKVLLENSTSPRSVASPPPPAEDTRFRRIMLGHFGDILHGKGRSSEENHN